MGSSLETKAATPFCLASSNTTSKSASLLTLSTTILRWTAFAAACILSTIGCVTEFAGFTITPTTDALGTNSHSNSNRFLRHRSCQKTNARKIPTGPVKTVNEANVDRVSADDEQNWNGISSLSGKGRRSSACRHND